MNEHKNIITIEDEIKEFSDKPVKSSALFKKIKELEESGGGGSSLGKTIFSGTVTSTPQEIEMTEQQFLVLPMYVGTINGEPITYIHISEEDDGMIWEIANDNDDGVVLVGSLDGITIVAEGADCEVELIDMGSKFITVPAVLQESTIYVEYPFNVLYTLETVGCGLGLHVESFAAGTGEGHSYAPIILYSNDAGDDYFDASIHIGEDTFTTWTVDPDTGGITGTAGGST